MLKQINVSVAIAQESQATIQEAITKMGEQLWELMEKGIDSKEDAKEKEPTSMGLSKIKGQDVAPQELSFATPSISVPTPKPSTTHPYSSFPPIPDVEEGNVKDYVMFGFQGLWQAQR